METLNNKYKVWHDNIIARGKNRVLTGYQEKHHIIPKSLGGSNSKYNLVALTPKEHFIIHILLCKFTLGKSRLKMLNALHAMMFFTTKRRGYKTSSRIVANLRIEFQKNNPVFDPEVRKKIGLGNKGKKTISPKYWTGKKLSDAHKENIRLGGLGKNKGKEYYWVKNETSNKLIKRDELNDYLNLGYKQGRLSNYVTDEFIKVQSEKRTAYWNRKKAHAL